MRHVLLVGLLTLAIGSGSHFDDGVLLLQRKGPTYRGPDVLSSDLDEVVVGVTSADPALDSDDGSFEGGSYATGVHDTPAEHDSGLDAAAVEETPPKPAVEEGEPRPPGRSIATRLHSVPAGVMACGQLIPDGYTYHPMKDSSGMNIAQMDGSVIQKVADACIADPSCFAFNSDGWRKWAVNDVLEDKWTDDFCKGLYTRGCPGVPPGYTFLPKKDLPAHDIMQCCPGKIPSNYVPAIAAACDADLSCDAFDTDGFLKTDLIRPYGSAWVNSACKGLYLKDLLTTRVPSTSTSSTTTTTEEPSASGDPHAVNSKGDRFDVRRAGKHVFIILPRGADPMERQLFVVAHVTPLKRADPCNDKLFIRGLLLSGSWLGQLGSLEFKTGRRAFDAPDTIDLRINGSQNISVEEFVRLVPKELAEVSRRHPQLPRQRARHVDTLVIKLHLGPSTITVGWAHTERPMTNWLWLNVAGLTKVREEIGGLLGKDDHVWAEKSAHTACGSASRPWLG